MFEHQNTYQQKAIVAGVDGELSFQPGNQLHAVDPVRSEEMEPSFAQNSNHTGASFHNQLPAESFGGPNILEGAKQVNNDVPDF